MKRLALLFARNGMGKSTICAVLRSAAEQNPRPIDERVHLGNVGAQMASLEMDGVGTVAFNAGTWNRATPPMMVFDQDFVRQNVHAAEEVTRENKRGLFRIIIGSAGVNLAREIEELDNENRAVNATIREEEAAIRAVVPAVTNIAAFYSADVPEDLEAKLEDAARNLKRAEEATELQRRPTISPTRATETTERTPVLLQKTLGGSLEIYRDKLRQHISKHHLDDKASRWLQYGVEHGATADCPFCDQPLQHSEIYEVLKTLFGPEYRNLAADVDAALSGLSTLLDPGPAGLERLLGHNVTLAEYWSSIVELPPLPRFSEQEIADIQAMLQLVRETLESKLSDLAAVAFPVQTERWAAMVEQLRRYDAAVDAANERITKVKAETPAVDAASSAQLRLEKLRALRLKGQEPIKGHLVTWKAAKYRHQAIASERTRKQEALRAHMAATADAYQTDVNRLLKRFGTNFTLCRTKASFVGGGQPNTEYCIDIDGYVIAAGDSGDRARPSFRTALSAGDKSSLALALFIVQANRRADLADVVLVFDDPFNSQDSGRQFETASSIRRLAALSKQVVVLSHDPRFLHKLLKDAAGLEISQQQIVQTGRWKGSIKAWSCEDENKADYVRRAERIREYAASQTHLPDSTAHLLAADIRVFMEEFLDQRFPGRFGENITLGLMCSAIADDPNDPLHAHKEDLRELNEFSRPDHHRGTSPPDPVELQAQCQKVVDILGHY